MLETAKKIMQLGRREKEEQITPEKKEERRRKRSSLARMIMSSSRVFAESPKEEAKEVTKQEEPDPTPRQFIAQKVRRRRISFAGRGEERGRRVGSHLSCPDLGQLVEREEERGGRGLVARLRGRRREEEEEEKVDTVDHRTATVFREERVEEQLIEINFE